MVQHDTEVGIRSTDKYPAVVWVVQERKFDPGCGLEMVDMLRRAAIPRQEEYIALVHVFGLFKHGISP